MAFSPNFIGKNAKGSSRQLQTGYQNGTVGTLTAGTPVAVNSSGNAIAVDITNEATVFAMVGVYAQDTLSGAVGQTVEFGRLENLTTSFNVGDPVFVGPSGTLINTKPDSLTVGFSSGCWIVHVGVIVQNEFDNTKKDLRINISIVGQV